MIPATMRMLRPSVAVVMFYATRTHNNKTHGLTDKEQKLEKATQKSNNKIHEIHRFCNTFASNNNHNHENKNDHNKKNNNNSNSKKKRNKNKNDTPFEAAGATPSLLLFLLWLCLWLLLRLRLR